jgi:hypothetical protein
MDKMNMVDIFDNLAKESLKEYNCKYLKGEISWEELWEAMSDEEKNFQRGSHANWNWIREREGNFSKNMVQIPAKNFGPRKNKQKNTKGGKSVN